MTSFLPEAGQRQEPAGRHPFDVPVAFFTYPRAPAVG